MKETAVSMLREHIGRGSGGLARAFRPKLRVVKSLGRLGRDSEGGRGRSRWDIPGEREERWRKPRLSVGRSLLHLKMGACTRLSGSPGL
ncbi:hypothetical protein Cadr_000015978 [Camelus dromedarius]|uniref:Uncharacterized protein n=1 Tax=Camelus dromedarius TaxID=9838 RepID=A0A5N4EB41_CAMDR|nr:hypothetical protein Cadr_000015978 [Camelus dromedarius]